MWRIAGTAVVVLVATGVLMSGQRLETPDGIELSGSWAPRNFTDAIGNAPGPGAGPVAVDYMGIPLNDAGRASALTASPSKLSMPERICDFYAPSYIVIGPMGLKIWNESELRTGATMAWVIGGWSDFVPIPIWMDGRPHPSKYAPHEKPGFTTGVWDNDVLTTYTTHMEAGIIRRNNTPHSDEATMTARFSRHDDILTITARIDDPIYLTEPYYLTRDFVLSKTPINPAAYPCSVTNVGIDTARVPHYNQGENPYINELTKFYGIPEEAILGGQDTMYPEFRKKIKDKYMRPDKCVVMANASTPDGCGRPGLYPPVN
jgi:hypothetical protein